MENMEKAKEPTQEQSEAQARKINDLLVRMIKALVKVDRGFVGGVDGDEEQTCNIDDVSTGLILEIAGSAALLRDRVQALENICMMTVEV